MCPIPELLPKALKLIRQIKDESSCDSFLKDLAPHIPPELLPEALEIMETFKERYYAAHAWFPLLPRLEELQVSFPSFATILDTLAYRKRSELIEGFPAMRNTLTRLGGETALDRCLQAMAEVCHQWR